MRKLLFLLALIPAMAVAQPRPKGAAGLTQLTGDVTAGPGTGSQAATLANIPAAVTATSTTGTVITSSVANSGTNSAMTVNTSGPFSGSTTLLVLKANGTTEHSFDSIGSYKSSGGITAQAGTVSACGNCNNPITLTGSTTGNPVTVSTPNGTTGINLIPAGTGAGASVQNNGDPVPGVHHTQTTAQVSMEFGATAATANALAVTFASAFSAAPSCTCADINAAPAACGQSVAAGTSGVTFKGTTGATDVISWICIGAR